MISLPGYRVEKQVHASPRGAVYLGRRDADDRRVAIKVFAANDPERELQRARAESEVLARLAGEGVPGLVELIEFAAHPILVSGYVSGVRLHEVPALHAVDAETFLTVAIGLVRTLERVHALRLVHRDLSPSNVIVNPSSFEVHLVDFELARPIGERDRGGQLEGTLGYISPEQTGRMGRGVDFRSDLYGVGACLYQLACGVPPFEGDDPLALIHAHIARAPRPIADRRADLSPTLGRIVEKLLRKEPSDRYQGCGALLRDLEVCREQLERSGAIADDLPLGTADAPSRVLFRGGLAGREREARALGEAFGRLVAASGVGVVALSGPPGIGKSSLFEIVRPAAARCGALIGHGKFDLYRRDLPFAGVTAALEAAIDQCLVEDDTRLEGRGERMRESLGGLVPVAVQLFPDLTAMVGEHGPPPALGAEETLRRTALTVTRLIRALGSPGRPLVLLLDDLQWADAGSLHILDEVVRMRDDVSVFACVTYRDGDVEEGHPFARLLEGWADAGVSLDRLAIGPLDDAAMLEMLGAALGRGEEVVAPLATCVAARAGRSPFQIQQFVHHLQEIGVLRAEPGLGWTWSLEDVAAADIPDSVVEVIALEIGRLPDSARGILQLASCIGDAFDAGLLCEVSSLDRSEVDAGLWRLAEKGLVAPCPAGYRFVHDRIREAAQSRFDDAGRAAVHHEVARVLMSRHSGEALRERAIEVADHLNRSRALIAESERLAAARINLDAGLRALAQGDAASALGYLRSGRELLTPDDWSVDDRLCWQLDYQCAEALRIAGEHDAALEVLDGLDARAASANDAAYVAYRRLNIYSMIDPARAVDVGLAALRARGVSLPRRPTWWHVRVAQVVTDWRLAHCGTDPWSPRDGQMSPERVLTMLLIAGVSGALIRVNARLMLLVVAYVARLTIRHGSVVRGSEAYVVGGYGHLRMLAGGSPLPSRRFCDQATAACDQVREPRVWTKGAVQVYGMLQPWFHARRLVLAPLRETYERGLEVGDSEFAYYAHYLAAVYRGLAGVPLPQTLEYMEESARIADRLRAGSRERLFGICQIYRLLAAGDPAALEAHADGLAESREPTDRAAIAPHALLALCLHESFPAAHRLASAVGDTIWNAAGSAPFTVDFQLFTGLAAAALAEERTGRTRRGLLSTLRRTRRCFRRWRGIGPDYAHYPVLLGAEAARLRGHTDRALAAYERAAASARESLHLHHVGLIRLRQASLLARCRRGTESARARADADRSFAEWGWRADPETV